MTLLMGLLLGMCVFPAQAVTIDFVPVSQSVSIGNSVEVSVRISGLGVTSDAHDPASSLSAFDLDVCFDPTVLSFSMAQFGDPLLGDQLDLFGFGGYSGVTAVTSGVVNIFELSLDSPDDLVALQVDSFILATLSFDALAKGVSALDVSINGLGDSVGNPLMAAVVSGSIQVTKKAVPEKRGRR
jgi:hypothetical protein